MFGNDLEDIVSVQNRRSRKSKNDIYWRNYYIYYIYIVYLILSRGERRSNWL